MALLLLPRAVGLNSHSASPAIKPNYLRGLLFAFNADRGGDRPNAEYSRFLTITPRFSQALYTAAGVRYAMSGAGLLVSDLNAIRGDTDQSNTDVIVELPAASSWTCQLVIDNAAPSAGNGGFWRAGATGTFFIENGTSSLPWVRATGTDILKPGSGAVWPTGKNTTLNILCRFVTSTSVDVWWHGKQQHTNTHAVAGEAVSLSKIGEQAGTEYPGTYHAARFWDRALDNAEMAALSSNSNHFYVPRQARMWLATPAAGGFFSRYYYDMAA